MKSSVQLLILSLGALAACGEQPASGSSAAPAKASGSASAPAQAASAAPAASSAPAASAAPAPSASASATPPEVTLANMFAGPPDANLKDSKPISGSNGVVLALPEGWDSSDDDSNYHTHVRKKEREVEKGVNGASIICGQFDNPDRKNDFKRMVYVDSVEKDAWEEPVDGTVGVGPYPAKIAKGTGKQVSQPHERVTYYVHTTPPGGKGVLCVASYPKSHPELEKEIVAALKGLKSTKGK